MIIPLLIWPLATESEDPEVVVHYRLTCDHDDCRAEAIPCFISPDFEVEEKDHYCPDHAPVHGFCAGCGLFIGVFDDPTLMGFCPDCVSEKLAEQAGGQIPVTMPIFPVFSVPVGCPVFKLEDVDIDW